MMQQQLNELWKYAPSIAAAKLDDDHDPPGFDKSQNDKIGQQKEEGCIIYL